MSNFRADFNLFTKVKPAVLIALLCLAFSSASFARLPHSDQVPSNALAVFGIGDTVNFWGKASALPFTKALQQFLASPQITANTDYQLFTLERQKLEAVTGFPLTIEELSKNVFSNLQVYLLPPVSAGGEPVIISMADARDKTKAGKLAQAIDKRNNEWISSQKPADGTAAAGPPPNTFEKITLNGAQISHIHVTGSTGSNAKDGYYGLSGNRFFFSNNRESLTRALKSDEKVAESINQNSEFKRLSEMLPWDAATVQGYIDGDAAMQLGGPAAASMALGSIPGLSKNNKTAFTLDIQPDGILGRSASSEDTGQKITAQPRTLAGLKQVPASPLVAVVYGMFDAESLYNSANSLLPALQAMQGGGAGGAAQSPLSQFEQQTGISIQQELVPALGNEVTFSINSLSINLLAPQVDLIVGAEVRDREKMQTVMTKLEKFIETVAEQFSPGVSPPQGNTPGGAPSGPPKFQDLQKDPFNVRSISIPAIPTVNPSYVILDKYVIISLSSAGLMGAIQRAAGQQASMTTSPAYSAVTSMAGTDKIISFTTVDVNQLINGVIKPGLALFGGGGNIPPEAGLFLDQVLTHVGVGSAVETTKNGVRVGYTKLSMQ